jgi:hypothetical protein
MTILRLQLNRLELLEQRQERLDNLKYPIEQWRTTSQPLRDLIWKQPEREADACKQYSFIVLGHVKLSQFRLASSPELEQVSATTSIL